MLYLASRRDNVCDRSCTAFMPQTETLLLTYLQLAQASERRRQPLIRDKLLLLVGVAALELDWDEISASCRERILQHNPRHMIRRWPDLATAVRAERFRAHLKQLKRKYSPEKAEHMLAALGLTLDDEPIAGPRLRERAAELVESLTPELDGATADRTAVSSDRGLAERTRGSATGPASAAPIATAPWWPFWLGLAAWIALAFVVVFGRG